MTVEYNRSKTILKQILLSKDKETLEKNLSPREGYLKKFPRGNDKESFEKRWEILSQENNIKNNLVDLQFEKQIDVYKHNIEHFIGTAKIPIGLAGPLLVNGLFANGEYYLPLATTEAALVASYSRGSQLITESGGCTSILLNEGVYRTPAFAFKNLIDVGKFLLWIHNEQENVKTAAESTTRYGKLTEFKITVEGNHVYLNFEFNTGDAAGQNMVTIATQKACEYIAENSPIKPTSWYVDANMSGDKKSSMQSFQTVRGKKVTAEVIIPAKLVHKRLHTSPEKIVHFSQMSSIGCVLSGTVGLQGHYANGLTALYIACGQDAACVAEAAVGITRFNVTDKGDLYVSVTLPNLIVGTIGGGTNLPSQKACLELMRLSGSGKANALAEVSAALCLAGEISISGAFASGTFSRAHQLLARTKKKTGK